MNFVCLAQIENQNVKTNRNDPFIGKYKEFEFSVNPAKELTEVFCRNSEILNPAKYHLNAMKRVC